MASSEILETWKRAPSFTPRLFNVTMASYSKRRKWAPAPKPPFRLLDLPAELRIMVYACVFESLNVGYNQYWHGTPLIYRASDPNPMPSDHLALLRTCRQIHQEAAFIWPTKPTFYFREISRTFDKLCILPPELRSRIRHLTVRSESPTTCLRLKQNTDRYYSGYPLHWALKLLPDLSLDHLNYCLDYEVSGRIMYDPVGYVKDIVDGMITYGTCWRKLRVMVQVDGRDPWSDRYAPREEAWWKYQPDAWNKMLLERDGEASGSCVMVYKQREVPVGWGSFSYGVVERPYPSDFCTLERYLGKPTIRDQYRISHSCPKQYLVLIVVKRGPNVDIRERGNPPYHQDDLRRLMGDMEWPEFALKFQPERWWGPNRVGPGWEDWDHCFPGRRQNKSALQSRSKRLRGVPYQNGSYTWYEAMCDFISAVAAPFYPPGTKQSRGKRNG